MTRAEEHAARNALRLARWRLRWLIATGTPAVTPPQRAVLTLVDLTRPTDRDPSQQAGTLYRLTLPVRRDRDGFRLRLLRDWLQRNWPATA